MCSGRAGAVPGRNRVPGTGSGELVPNRFWVTGFVVPGNQFREPGPGFDGSDRFCGSKKRGSRHQGSGFKRNQVLGTRGIKKVPVPEISLPRF